MDCSCSLLQIGCAVNSTGDKSGQSPAHLAACGGEAFCLLWLLQTGADANQQVFESHYFYQFLAWYCYIFALKSIEVFFPDSIPKGNK